MTTTAPGMAATSLPGAVLMMIGAPHAAADTSAADLVSSSSSSYQPALDPASRRDAAGGGLRLGAAVRHTGQ